MDRYVSTYYDSMEQNENGDWVLYDDAAARIAELEAQLATMTDERDSESRWAKEYSDKADKLEAQLAAIKQRAIEFGGELAAMGFPGLESQVLKEILDGPVEAPSYNQLKEQLAAAQERERSLQQQLKDIDVERRRNLLR